MLSLNPEISISIKNAFQERGILIERQGDSYILPFATTIEKIEEIMKILRLCPITSQSDMLNIHSFSIFPNPTPPTPLPFGPATTEYIHEAFRLTAGLYPTRSQAQNDKNIWEGILKHAEGLTGKALILCYGHGTEIPFMQLATQFDEVTVMDTHEEIIEENISYLPPELKVKIKKVVIDITGAFFSIEHQVDALPVKPDTFDIARMVATIIRNPLNNANKPDLKEYRKYQFVVSSMATSQVGPLPVDMARSLIVKKYPHYSFPLLNGVIESSAIRVACLQLACDHMNFIANCCATGGSIYWVDHPEMAITYCQDGKIVEETPGKSLAISYFLEQMRPHFDSIVPGNKWDWDTKKNSETYLYERGDVKRIADRDGCRMKMQEYLFSNSKLCTHK